MFCDPTHISDRINCSPVCSSTVILGCKSRNDHLPTWIRHCMSKAEAAHHLGRAVEGEAADVGGDHIDKGVRHSNGPRVGVDQTLVVSLHHQSQQPVSQQPVSPHQLSSSGHQNRNSCLPTIACHPQILVTIPKGSRQTFNPAWTCHLRAVQGVAQRGDAGEDLLHGLVEGGHRVVEAPPQQHPLQGTHRDHNACHSALMTDKALCA